MNKNEERRKVDDHRQFNSLENIVNADIGREYYPREGLENEKGCLLQWVDKKSQKCVEYAITSLKKETVADKEELKKMIDAWGKNGFEMLGEPKCFEEKGIVNETFCYVAMVKRVPSTGE